LDFLQEKKGIMVLGFITHKLGQGSIRLLKFLKEDLYRGEYVDISSMGVILFLMVTGSLPYTSEANINDPLYKYIYMKKRDKFVSAWRRYNQRED